MNDAYQSLQDLFLGKSTYTKKNFLINFKGLQVDLLWWIDENKGEEDENLQIYMPKIPNSN